MPSLLQVSERSLVHWSHKEGSFEVVWGWILDNQVIRGPRWVPHHRRPSSRQVDLSLGKGWLKGIEWDIGLVTSQVLLVLRFSASCALSLGPLVHPRTGNLEGIPGILQARTLEWVAISFSNAWKWKGKVKSLSRVRLCATPWTAAYQALPSMGFSRQEYWSGVPLPSPRLSTHIPNYRVRLQWVALIVNKEAGNENGERDE